MGAANWSGLPYVLGAIVVVLVLRDVDPTIGNAALALVVALLLVTWAKQQKS